MPWRLALRIGAACLALQAPPRDFARTQIRRHSSVADAENAVEELFVRNVHHTTSENELRDAFSLACADACVVCDVAIPRCRTTGRGRGFAFVTITRQPGGSWPSGFHIANRHLLVERNRDRGGVGASIALNAKIADAQNADAVFDLHEKEGGLFSATNFATAMHRLGRPGAVALDPLNAPRRSEKAKRLVKAVVASIAKDRWDARGLTNACWGASKSGLKAPDLFSAISNESTSRIAEFTPQHLANLAWATARAKAAAPALFGAIASTALPQLGKFKPQELANLAWAFSTAGQGGHVALYDGIAAAAVEMMPEFKAQELSNLVWAFSTARGADAAASKSDVTQVFYTAAALAAASNVQKFNAQNLANTAWAFSTAGYVFSERENLVAAELFVNDLFDADATQHAQASAVRNLFDAIAEAACTNMVHFKPQELANLAWAFSKYGDATHAALYFAVAEAASNKMNLFKPQELASIAWAFGKAESRASGKVDLNSPVLFGAVALHAPAKMDLFKPQELANLAWAFAVAGQVRGQAGTRVFEALADAAMASIVNFECQHLAITAWAFATAEVPSPELFARIAAATQWRSVDFNTQTLANTAWAFATAGVSAPALFRAVGNSAVEKMDDFNTQELANLAAAFASETGLEAPALFQAISLAAIRRVSEFKPREAAALAHAFSGADHASPQLFDSLAASGLVDRCSELKPSALSNLAAAFACQLYHARPAIAQDLMRAVAAAARPQLQFFDATELAKLANAFSGAEALLLDEALLADVSKAAQSKVSEAEKWTESSARPTDSPERRDGDALRRLVAQLAPFARVAPTQRVWPKDVYDVSGAGEAFGAPLGAYDDWDAQFYSGATD